MASTATVLAPSRVNEFPPNSKRKCIEATIVADGTDGSNTTPIPASLFGLTFIEQSSSVVKSDNTKVYATSPTYDGSGLMCVPGVVGTPAVLPAGTYYLVLEGY